MAEPTSTEELKTGVADQKVSTKIGDNSGNIRDKIGALSFNGSDDGNFVDIVNDYTWTNVVLGKSNVRSSTVSSTTETKFTSSSSVPFVVCVERKQTVASNIMNMIAGTMALSDSLASLKGDINSLKAASRRGTNITRLWWRGR